VFAARSHAQAAPSSHEGSARRLPTQRLQQSLGNHSMHGLLQPETFSDDPVTNAAPGNAAPANGETQPGAIDPTVSPNPAQPMQSAPRAGKVTSVVAITDKAGALSGFPALPGAPDLNSPGPVNDTQTGRCQNVQQIKFELSGITPAEVDLTRLKDGVAGPVGHEQPRKGPDGPSDPTKLRRDSFIAVADCPGIQSASAGYPLRYAVDFQLFAFDVVSKAILAKATYSVNILKQSLTDPSPTNEFKNLKTTIM